MGNMGSEDYRDMARNCLRMADSTEDGKPLWVTLAQSWLQLAEMSEQIGSGRADGIPTVEAPPIRN
jgi:hypothetical protein